MSDYDERDQGVYRCFGRLIPDRYRDSRRYGRSRDHVYMDVNFRSGEPYRYRSRYSRSWPLY